MAGHCVQKLPHKTDKCDSGDGLQVFEEDGKYSGFCFACSTYVADPYGDGVVPLRPQRRAKTAEEISQEIAEIQSLPTVSLPARKLDKESLEYFDVKVGLSEQDGKTPALHYYPYTKDGAVVGYQVRLIDPKRFWVVGDIANCDLFGWRQALATGAKRLFITEGACDAIALYQALKAKEKGGKWEHLNPAVVSLTRGAGGAKRDITDNLTRIKANFKEVVFVFDMDESGEKARHDALSVLPTAQTVTLPAKDANACLMEGRSLAMCNAVLFKSETPKNTRIVNATSLYTAAREQAKYGLSWPWPSLTKLTRGIRFGETYYLGAGVKMGKSELVNTIGAHLITEHNLPIFMAKPEEANRKTVQMVLGKVAGKFFHDPDVEFDYEAYDLAAKKVGDKLNLLSLYQHMGWDSLRTDIISAAANGCKAVFIDPITNLVNGISAGETDTVLKEIAQELAAIALDQNIVIFIFCHLKAPQAGEPHERGGKVYSSQFAGSRAMMRSCNLMLGLEGSKDPDLDESTRNMRKLVILEDREFGASGTVPLYWDKYTSLFNEVKEAA